MVNEWALLGDGVLGDNIGPCAKNWHIFTKCMMCKKLAYFYEVHSQKSGIF
jgi:hypothetical protein